MSAPPESTAKKAGSGMAAGPLVAALIAGGTAYAWAEAAIRYLATNTSLGNWYFIFPARDGDIVAMWLTSIVAGIVVFGICYLAFRKRAQIGSLRMWTIIFAISLIIAPLIGEIGTPIGI